MDGDDLLRSTSIPDSSLWSVAAHSCSEPLTEDVFLDGVAAICGDGSPDLRDEYRARAVESRAAAFVRTLDEIRDL